MLLEFDSFFFSMVNQMIRPMRSADRDHVSELVGKWGRSVTHLLFGVSFVTPLRCQVEPPQECILHIRAKVEVPT